MAKKSIVVKNKKKLSKINSNYIKRKNLKRKLIELGMDFESVIKIWKILDKTSKFSPIKFRKRCEITGRPRGYRGSVGLCRGALRYYASYGMIAGVKKG